MHEPTPILSQGATLEELRTNLQEVIQMLLEDGNLHIERRLESLGFVQIP